MKKKSYSNPVSEIAGYRTFVSPKSQKGLPGQTSLPEGDDESYPQRALPDSKGQPQDKEIHMGPFSYNTPDQTTGITNRPRTLPEPGAERGIPVNKAVPGRLAPRRTSEKEASSGRILYQPEGGRQKVQRGSDKWKAKLRYKRNRRALRTKAKKRYKRNKNKSWFKKNMQIRRKNPRRFMRKKASENLKSIAFTWPGIPGVSNVDSLLPETERILLKTPNGYISTSVDVFLNKAIFMSEEDIERAFEMVDTEVGWVAYDEEPPPAKKEAGYVFYHEEKGPSQQYNNWKGDSNKGAPDGRQYTLPSSGEWIQQQGEQPVGDSPNWGHDVYVSPTTNNPGPGRMIPNDPSYANKNAMSLEKFAASLSGQKPLKAYLNSYRASSDVWTFDCGNERVKFKFAHNGEIHASCTCCEWNNKNASEEYQCEHVQSSIELYNYLKG